MCIVASKPGRPPTDDDDAVSRMDGADRQTSTPRRVYLGLCCWPLCCCSARLFCDRLDSLPGSLYSSTLTPPSDDKMMSPIMRWKSACALARIGLMVRTITHGPRRHSPYNIHPAPHRFILAISSTCVMQHLLLQMHPRVLYVYTPCCTLLKTPSHRR
jgi:hypothetical protein